jgi:methanogenesis imperfect marker protein 11
MSDIYTSSQLRNKFADKKWIMSYSRLTAVVDPRSNDVLFIEEYGPAEGVFVEGWRALHYPATSRLVKKTYREGAATVAILEQGKATLQLTPSFAPFGISKCQVDEKNVHITFEGLGGAGVSSSFSRGMAEGVESVTVHSDGGGAKVGSSTISLARKHILMIGVDDTDNDEEGATYALVDTISKEICKKLDIRYLSHVNVQLYPYNKHKTRNCFATMVGIIYEKPEQKKQIVTYFKEQLFQHTVSEQTAMTVYEGFDLPCEFVDYCTSLKFRMATDMDELKSVATTAGVELYEITGERGLFGAIGALGYWDRPDFAAKLPSQCQ